MAIECVHCGDEIDIGHYKDDDEMEDDWDTFEDGEIHVTTTFRQGFREGGGTGRIHIECFEEVFGFEVSPPAWGTDGGEVDE